VSFAATFLEETAQIVSQIDAVKLDEMAEQLAMIREAHGRLFFLGLGGGAGHASHAVNDFRKIGGFEAYTPTDNVSELTARINDDGWETSLEAWLRGSRLRSTDGIFVFSVGGGDRSKGVSVNLVRALEYASSVGARIFGIVGRDGGFTACVSKTCVIVPTLNPDHVTPHTEGFQAILWHLLVSHPTIRRSSTKPGVAAPTT